MLKHFTNLAFSAVSDLYFQKVTLELVEQCVLVIPALGRQRQDNSKLGVSLDQRARLSQKQAEKGREWTVGGESEYPGTS